MNLLAQILLCFTGITFILSNTTPVAAALTAVQSSTFNRMTADLAIDRSPLTCSKTGYGSGNWWKVDLGAPLTISAVAINGSSGAVTVRIGPKSDAYGFRSGFRTNPKCVEIISGLVLGTKQTYQCAFPSTGQFLTIESSDTATGQLQLCTVELITA